MPLLLLPVLLACPGEGTGPLPPGPDTTATGPVSFAAGIQPIFTANCALSGCHAGTTPTAGQNLSEGLAYQNIVDVPSVEQPTLRRVRPFLPDSSYLVHKIQGTQATVGGIGERMPRGLPPLPDSLIARIRAWITQGAPNN